MDYIKVMLESYDGDNDNDDVDDDDDDDDDELTPRRQVIAMAQIVQPNRSTRPVR